MVRGHFGGMARKPSKGDGKLLGVDAEVVTFVAKEIRVVDLAPGDVLLPGSKQFCMRLTIIMRLTNILIITTITKYLLSTISITNTITVTIPNYYYYDYYYDYTIITSSMIIVTILTMMPCQAQGTPAKW